MNLSGLPVAQASPGLSMLFPFLAIGVVFYLLIFRPEKRRQNQQKMLLEGLKKDDRVVTIGGIYGVVANVRRDIDRVTLKVDEATNTKIDVSVSAIARITNDETTGEKAR